MPAAVAGELEGSFAFYFLHDPRPAQSTRHLLTSHPMSSRTRFSQLFGISLIAACASCAGGSGSGGALPAPTPDAPLVPPESFLQIYPVDDAQGAALETYFRWEDALGENDYLLQLATDPTFSSKLLYDSGPLPAGTTQALLPPGILTANQFVYWRVLARNANGETAAANGPFSMQTGDPAVALAMKLNYNGSKSQADPDYLDTLGNFYYPLGKGPVTLGYAPEKLVIVLSLRGGNENEFNLASPLAPSPFLKLSILPHGWFGVEPNYPVFDTALGENYEKATAGIGLLVQFLRANSGWMNLDPDRLFSMGRSFGGIHSYSLAFRGDLADLESPDPVKHFSSRPNYILPKNSVTSLECMDPSLIPEMSEEFLSASDPSTPIPQAMAENSAYYWLLHPELYGRETTPPMCLTYNFEESGICGEILNPHHGIFGVLMAHTLNEYSASSEPGLKEASGFVDSTQLSEEQIYEQMAMWIETKLAQ